MNWKQMVAALFAASVLSAQSKTPYSNWSDYGGTSDSMQYSALKQIDRTNVGRLKLAWFHPAPGPSGRFSFNPLVVDGVMYVVSRGNAIVALDAATGRQLWTHPNPGQPTNRGFNYWESKDRSERRLIFSVNSYLQELDAKTGVTINTFGNDGRVNLREGLGRDVKTMGEVQSGTPGRIFENLIILGSAPGEMYVSPPGDLRAYDVRTGKLAWQFHTIPHPGEFGYDTWPPDAWTYMGGVNTWGEISVDEKRGIAYFPLGSPTYDLYGADRHGANLFGNSLLALDARTGKRLWHFQAVHHDLWDYDLVTSPKLITVRHDGKPVDVVVQATKFGFLYVLDRVTGKPLWPVEERPVPRSDVPGEQSWPTQPFPTAPPPFARQRFTAEDINPYLDPPERERLRDIVANARNEGLFTPQSTTRDQLSTPGENGGANWGSVSADPSTGMVYVRSFDAPAIHKLTAADPGVARYARGNTEQRGFAVYLQHCMPCHGADRGRITYPKDIDLAGFRNAVRSGRREMPAFSEDNLGAQALENVAAYLRNPDRINAPVAGRDGRIAPPPPLVPPPPAGQTRYYGPFGNTLLANNGLIAFSPPWSELVAYDLNHGTIKWRVPLGTTPGLAAKGIRNTGSSRFIRNGPVTTGGGLIFVGTGPDRFVHALDKDNGKMLWEAEIDANPDGIPAVYEVAGRQYVAFFAAAAPGARDTIAFKTAEGPESQGYYVFALPY